MIEMTLGEIANVVGGTLVPATDAEVIVAGPAYVDSRAPEEAGLYVAIRGERVDGHDFAQGAHAVLGSRPTGSPTVVVDDPVAALGLLARQVRDRLPATVVALTGSQGKTGTKDMLTQILAAHGATVGTRANLNNELGVPLTVLRATQDTAYLVVEMGARGSGHIAYLCEIARPTVAGILNIGTAHLSEFGSRAGIAQAKGEIIEALPAQAWAVLNADDEMTAALRSRTDASILTFGESGTVHWQSLTQDALGRPSFELEYGEESCSVFLGQPGAHQVANAAAAVALAVAAGVPFAEAAPALNHVQTASRWRMELSERADGAVILNDAYNANPESMLAALDTLAAIGTNSGRRTIAVLGVMLELGAESQDAHHAIGRGAGQRGIDTVVVIGADAEAIATGAQETGSEAILTAGRDEALRWLGNNVGAQDVVLIKASRGAALETIAHDLLA